jgi:hypothetical protein
MAGLCKQMVNAGHNFFSSPPAFSRPTLDETGAAAMSTILFLSRWHRGRFFYGAEEPVI